MMKSLPNRRFPWSFAILAACLIISPVVFFAVRGAMAQAATSTPTLTQEPVALLSLLPGQAIQGILPVKARIDLQDVQSIELTFGYSGDPTRTWFFIAQFAGPAQGEKLADWDTTTLTDGNYTLRLVVVRQDSSQFVARVAGLRVRNYTPIETDTPAPTATAVPGEPPPPTLTPTASPTPIYPTPTPLPPNPLQVSSQDISFSLLRGALGAVVVFAFLGLYGSIRRRFRQ